MPFGKTLSDFYTEQMDREQTRKNDRWTKLMQALGLAKDVWGKFQERAWELEDVTPGSKKYNLAYKQAVEWPGEVTTAKRKGEMEDIEKKLSLELQYNKDWTDYQNLNPGKSQKQLEAEFYQTPEGQAFLDDQAKRAKDMSDYESANRIKEIQASNTGRGTSTDVIEWYNLARKEATAKFYIQDPDTGEYTLKPGVTEAVIKEFFYKWVDSAAQADRPRLRAMFDAWIKDPYWDDIEKTTVVQTGQPVDMKSLLESIQKIVAGTIKENPNVVLPPPPKSPAEQAYEDPASLFSIMGGGMGQLGAAWMARQKQEGDEKLLAKELQDIAQYSKDAETQKIVGDAVRKLNEPGAMDKSSYEAIYALAQALKEKFKNLKPKSILEQRR